MKITFLGAAKTVTGSNFLVEAAGKKFLVDCGMYQGKVTEEFENSDPFLYDVNSIDFMLLTHAHIDHSGRIPKLYNEGLVKAIGVSNFNESNINLLLEKTQIVPAVNQVECHPLLNQNDLISFCRKNNIAVTAYSPLGAERSGATLLENKVIVDMAERIKVTPAQILLAWQIQRDIIVIPKSVRENRIHENYAAQVIELDAADIKIIDELNQNHRFFDGSAFENPSQGYDKIF